MAIDTNRIRKKLVVRLVKSTGPPATYVTTASVDFHGLGHFLKEHGFVGAVTKLTRADYPKALELLRAWTDRAAEVTA